MAKAKATSISLSKEEQSGLESLVKRHKAGQQDGTLSFIVSFDVVKGAVPLLSAGPTHNEQDFAAHIEARLKAEPDVKQWHFITDNLNTHCSETLVRLVAQASALTDITPPTATPIPTVAPTLAPVPTDTDTPLPPPVDTAQFWGRAVCGKQAGGWRRQ